VPGGDRIDEKRLERWRRIVTEAAEQCERGRVPEIAPPMKFAAALRDAASSPIILAWEREEQRSLRDGLQDALALTPQLPLPLGEGRGEGSDGRSRLSLFVGPEGGFSRMEIEVAREAEVLTVSLGSRILRTETAGPILAALALYEAGDLEPPQAQPS
jgi:16S rRNA (uracil1498-N3)-methyltransferase